MYKLLASITTTLLLLTASALFYYQQSNYNLGSYSRQQVQQIADKILLGWMRPPVKEIKIILETSEEHTARCGEVKGTGVIWISRGDLRALKNDDELAGLIAHEYSHLLLGHTRFGGDVWIENAPASEAYADLLGSELTRLAGYDQGRRADYWLRESYTMKDNWMSSDHPEHITRYTYLRQPKWISHQFENLVYNVGRYVYLLAVNEYYYLNPNYVKKSNELKTTEKIVIIQDVIASIAKQSTINGR